MDFYAQSNKIKEIPLYICANESIQRLNLKSNQIEKIPKEICGMKGLGDEELEIFGNPIKEVEDKDFVANKVVDWMKIQNILFAKK
jgi:Leucine-rich repeat (LRR) protein